MKSRIIIIAMAMMLATTAEAGCMIHHGHNCERCYCDQRIEQHESDCSCKCHDTVENNDCGGGGGLVSGGGGAGGGGGIGVGGGLLSGLAGLGFFPLVAALSNQPYSSNGPNNNGDVPGLPDSPDNPGGGSGQPDNPGGTDTPNNPGNHDNPGEPDQPGNPNEPGGVNQVPEPATVFVFAMIMLCGVLRMGSKKKANGMTMAIRTWDYGLVMLCSGFVLGMLLPKTALFLYVVTPAVIAATVSMWQLRKLDKAELKQLTERRDGLLRPPPPKPTELPAPPPQSHCTRCESFDCRCWPIDPNIKF